jgi:hypothetical protein
MKLSALIVIVLICSIACNSKKDNSTQQKKNVLPFSKDLIIRKFTLPYDENLQLDTNSLIFYQTKSFDTSYLIHIKNIGSEIVGTYYQSLPRLSRDLEGYEDNNIKFLFYQGFSFSIKESLWDSIRNNAEKILTKDSSIQSKACFDCGSYYLAYDLQSRHDNKENEVDFGEFSKYLKASLISRINKIRQELETHEK